MKISYKVLKKYLPDLPSVEEVSEALIMHCAEVEEIVEQGENLKNVYIGQIIECEKHGDSDKLNCVKVDIAGKIIPIVCGATNVKVGLKIPVAVVGAKLSEDFTIARTKIRGEISEGMICSEDELGLTNERQAGIMELPENALLGISMKEFFGLDDYILEVDNKAINHRAELFSHIGIIRELATIFNLPLELDYIKDDFSGLKNLPINNTLPNYVKRYMGLKISGVSNISSPDFIKDVLNSAGVDSKGLLIDIANYSLYFYGQPAHIFDADTLEGDIIIRKAIDGEKFVAIDEKEYELNSADIVISDDKKILALAGIIGGKSSAVSDKTKNILIEVANFDQGILRKTGRKIGLRTDSLNVFEKGVSLELASRGLALILSILKKEFSNIAIDSFCDFYKDFQKNIIVDYDLDFINKLIGSSYSEEDVINILKSLGIQEIGNKLQIPFFRQDISFKADIAEEIARIKGYNNIKETIPRVDIGAVNQTKLYNIKNLSRNFFVNNGFFDLYNYSFVSKKLLEKLNTTTDYSISLKNYLSEDMTHMRNSLIPNLILSLEKNSRNYSNVKIFEIGNVFNYSDFEKKEIAEKTLLSGLVLTEEKIAYYDLQKIINDLFFTLGITKVSFDIKKDLPDFAHKGRIASIIIRGKEVGILGEIHPTVAKKFDLKNRVGFFEINLNLIEDAVFTIPKIMDNSIYQENNFDLSFVIDKNLNGKKILSSILSTDKNIIKKVELTDIYEDEIKMQNSRSLTFKIYIQSTDGTIDDKIKGELIEKIVSRVGRIGGELRK